MTLPSPYDAPAKLLGLDGHCGLIAAWVALRYFGRKISCSLLATACGYSRKEGVFTIGLAVALKQQGLEVAFCSDPDPDIKPIERRFYATAKRLNLPLLSAQPLGALLHRVQNGQVVIVFYDTPGGEGHFSPLLGQENGELLLPHAEPGRMPRRAFLRAWRAPGIARQCVIVSGSETPQAQEVTQGNRPPAFLTPTMMVK